MTRSKSTPWIAGTVIVSLLLFVASWFLAISPVVAATDEAKSLSEAQSQQNEVLQAKLAQLKKQSLKLDVYKAQLATMQAQIPPVTAMADFQRQISATAATYGVTIVSVVVAPSTQVVPTAPAAPATTDPATSTDGSTTSTDATTEAAAPAAPSGLEGFYQLPVTLEVIGNFGAVQAFLNDLQSDVGRTFLVSTLSGTATKDAEANAGHPATVVGDLDLVITGSAFVLTSNAPAAPVDPDAVPPALPVPPADKNPLVPIG